MPFSPESTLNRRLAILLIAGVTILRLVYLASFCPLDLANDEAHYWDWSRNLDWCYYSKGPFVAWLIRASCEVFGHGVFAVRFPAVVCGGLLLAGLYTLTLQTYANSRLALGVVIAALTLPIVNAGAFLMTIDAPFTCTWMWALVFAHRAVSRNAGGTQNQSAPWAWWAAGGCILVGVLAKHTMVLWLPCFALFLGTTPSLRFQLLRAGFWSMAGVGMLGWVPIVAWNAGNDWVTFRHTQGHAGFAEDDGIHWLGPIRYLGGQFAILLGFWFVAWARVMWRHRPARDSLPNERFLWWMSAPTFLFFGLFSWKNGGGGANWPIAGYLSGMVLVAGWLPAELVAPRAWYRRMANVSMILTAACGVLVTAWMMQPMMVQPILMRIGNSDPTTPRLDPTSRLRGWRHLAGEVDRLRAELRGQGVEPVLASERWTQTGELAFYCDQNPRVFALGLPFGDRYTQCDLWRPNPVADPSAFQGRTFLIVNLRAEDLHGVFESIDSTQVIEYRENGRVVADWPLTVGRGFRGFNRKTVVNPH